MPPNSNPFHYDTFNMGRYVGTNVAIMFGKFEDDRHDYLIVIDRETGEAVRISFTPGAEKPTFFEIIGGTVTLEDREIRR